jgi:uncharacterized delta-60 repeat protein
MPSHIEINKNSSFPSASSADRIVMGTTPSGRISLTDNNGVTTYVGDNTPYTASYKVCTSKLTQINEGTLTSGYLTVGKTYGIDTYIAGDDFSNVANVRLGTINTKGCIFTATGTTPTVWTNGTNILDMLYPVSTIEENTLGFIPYWKPADVGRFYFNFSQSVDPNKIIPFISPNSTNNLLSTYEVDSQAYNFFDDTFDSYQGGDGFNQQVRAIAAQPDGKILVGGNFTSYTSLDLYRIARLNGDGSVDTSFIYGGGGGFNNRVRKIVVQDDGKILVGGDFTQYNDSTLEIITECSGIVRLTNSGSVDPDFQSGPGIGFTRSLGSGEVGGGNVYDIVVQPDGNILVGGWFDQYDDAGGALPAGRLIRLDASGSVDATFVNQDGFSNVNTDARYDRVSSIALQPDGKIICAGQFDTYKPIHTGSSYDCAGIIKLNSDASVDTTFYNNIGTGFGNDWVNVVRLQDDGKIVIGMNGNNNPIDYNGTSVDYLTRLNSDGTLDIDFNAIIINEGQFSSGPVNDAKVLTSGHIVAVGYFSGGIFRVNSNGYIACEYNGGFNSSTYVLETQPYGKILVGGDFGTYGPGITFTTKIARLYGSYDVVLTSRDVANNVADELLSDTPIEIRQYI